MQAINEEFGNILRSWQYAIDRRNDEYLYALCPAIYFYALRRSWYAPAIKRIGEAIAVLEPIEQKSDLQLTLLAHLHASRGDCHFHLSQYVDATTALEQGLAYARHGEDPMLIGFTLSRAADVAHARGQYQAGLKFAHNALAMADEADYNHGKAVVHRELSSIYYSLGKYELAGEHAQLSLDLNELGGDSLVRALHCLGLVAHNRGNFADAKAHLLKSAEVIRSHELRFPIGHSWTALAWVYCSTGELDKAREYTNEALTNALAIEDTATVAVARDIWGIAERLDGNFDAALELQTEALAINRVLGRKAYEAINLNHLGRVQQLRGDYKAAHGRYDECLAICAELDHSWTRSRALDGLAQLALQEDDLTAAYTHNIAALIEAHKIASPMLMISGLIGHAAWLLATEGEDAVHEAGVLIASALAQSATRFETRMRAQALWDAEPLADLTDDDIAAIQTRAEASALADLVTAIVGDS